MNIVNSEIASSSAYGVRHSSGTTTVSNTNIINNSSPGVYNDDSSYLVDATNNWWGDASGPYNSTTNASGTGSTVSDYVDFSDWLTEPVVFGGTTTTPPTCTENCYSNVLFLPGIMGSKLSSSTDECWFDYLESDGTISGSDEEFKCILMTGTETPYTDPVYATEVLADAGPFGAIEVYESILNDLDAWDSELGIEHEALPYDWRYDFETIVRHTASTSNGMYVDPSASVSDSNNPFYLSVTNLASTSKTGKVTVVAHSMGGLVAKEMMIYLEEKGLEDKIDRIILVASPQLGTPKGFGALLHGYDMALDPLGVSLDEAEARYLSRNMQSVYNLLPSAEYFSSVSNPVAVMEATTSVTQKNTSGDTIAQFDTADNVLITNHGQYLASASLQMLFMTDDINHTRPEFDDVDAAEVVPYEYVSRADTVHDSLDAWTPPDGVELITVAGWGLETFGQAEYKRYVTEVCDGSCTVVEERVVMSPITTIEGDETVVAPSALYSSNDTNVERWWLDLEDYKDSNTNRDHSDIFAVDDLRLLVKSTLTGSSSSYTYLHTSTSTLSNPTGNRMQYLLHSPLTLGFRDAQGRYTGLKEDGTVIEEIPGTSYQLFGEVKFLSIPEEISGELEMIGIDDGKFTLEVRKVTGTSKIVEESAFVAVDTKKGMRVSLAQEGKKRSSIDKSLKNLELTIDKYDGKGEQEVKTFEYNAKIYKTRNMEKMEKQPKFEETATSTNKINSNENSTTTESVTEHMEPNNATSTATSTSSGPASSDKFPAGLLPLTMASVFGIEIKRFKKKVAVSSALFLAFGVGLYLVLFVPYWLSLIDLRTVGNIRRAITFGLDDDVFWMTMTILPAILVSLSLLHYKSREGVYKAWLVYSTLGLVTFIYFVVYTETHSSGWFGPMFVFVPLGIVYIAGSIIIWFYGFLTRKRHVK